MKTTLKAVVLTAFLAAVPAVQESQALVGSDAIQAEYTQKAATAMRIITTQSMMTVTYVGTSTQAVVAIGTGTFKTFLPGPDATVDLNYDLSNAAYDTAGELCDVIEALANYKCALADSKRNDNSLLAGNIAAATANDAKAVGGYSVLIDSAGIHAGYVGGTADVMRLGIKPATGKRVVLKYCIGNINAVDTLRVWGKLAKYAAADDGVTRNDTTLVYSAITADDTDKTIGSIYGGRFAEFEKDEHVVIGSNDNDTAQAAANLIECNWDEK